MKVAKMQMAYSVIEPATKEQQFTCPFPLEAYQAGAQPSTEMFHSEQAGVRAVYPLVLVDAISVCMAHEEKGLCKIGEFALGIVFDVASVIMGKRRWPANYHFSRMWSSVSVLAATSKRRMPNEGAVLPSSSS
uniref:transformation/transcription domain-associated protein-like isoform X1 n=1 Tax=Myxine glutinosa TaxID=7769 RepID=UPI00358E4AB6